MLELYYSHHFNLLYILYPDGKVEMENYFFESELDFTESVGYSYESGVYHISKAQTLDYLGSI